MEQSPQPQPVSPQQNATLGPSASTAIQGNDTNTLWKFALKNIAIATLVYILIVIAFEISVFLSFPITNSDRTFKQFIWSFVPVYLLWLAYIFIFLVFFAISKYIIIVYPAISRLLAHIWRIITTISIAFLTICLGMFYGYSIFKGAAPSPSAILGAFILAPLAFAKFGVSVFGLIFYISIYFSFCITPLVLFVPSFNKLIKISKSISSLEQAGTVSRPKNYFSTKFILSILSVNTISIISLGLIFGVIFIFLNIIDSNLPIVNFILVSLPFVFLVTTITAIFLIWLIGVNNSDVALRFVRTVKTIILLMLPFGPIIVLFLAGVFDSCMLCDGGGSGIGWIILSIYVGFLPYSFAMLVFGIPYLQNKAETIFDQEYESGDQVETGTNVGKGNIIMADPRFPTLDAQTESQNTPNNKK